MRPFEIIGCLLAIAAMSVMLFAPSRHRTLRLVCLILAPTLAVHAVVEGLHWQLIPFYLATLLLIAYALADQRWLRLSRLPRISLAAICALLAASSLLLSWLMPMFRFPKPSGQFVVGTRNFHLTDATRTEENGHTSSGKRELIVQAWYPAQPGFFDRRAVYQRRKEVTDRASYRAVLKTNSWQDAKIRPNGPYPVLIYNPGWNGERTEGTYQAEEMASHGFIVVAVDHTFFGGLVEFPDGSVADSRNAPTIGDFGHTTVAEQWALGGKYVRIEAQDDIFVLNQLEAMNQNPSSPFFHQLDLSRVGVMGFSIGGAASVQMAWQDPRIKAVLNLDGWEFGDVAQHGLAKPMMVIYEDKHGVIPDPPTPAPTPDHGPANTAPTIEQRDWQFSTEDYANVTGTMQQNGGYLLFIAGTHHVDFTDRSLFSPIPAWTGHGSVPPHRVHAIVNAYALAFFSHYLEGTQEQLIAAPAGNPSSSISSPYPEVEYHHFDGNSAEKSFAKHP
jgi:dienelactone hydrolase